MNCSESSVKGREMCGVREQQGPHHQKCNRTVVIEAGPLGPFWHRNDDGGLEARCQ